MSKADDCWLMAVLVIVALLMNVNSHAKEIAVEWRTATGELVSVERYLAQREWVLVNVLGALCPPCVEEMPELSALHEDYVEHGFSVLGLAIDFPSFGLAEAAQARQFLDDYFIEFPFVLADQARVQQFTGTALYAMPSSYLFGPDGQLRHSWLGAMTQAQVEHYMRNNTEFMR